MSHNGYASKRRKMDYGGAATSMLDKRQDNPDQSVDSTDNLSMEIEDVEHGSSQPGSQKSIKLTRRATSFSDLPNELLLNILNNLRGEKDRFCFSLVVPCVAPFISDAYEHAEISPEYLNDFFNALLQNRNLLSKIEHIEVQPDEATVGVFPSRRYAPKFPPTDLESLDDEDDGTANNTQRTINRVLKYLEFAHCGRLKSDRDLLTDLAGRSAYATLALLALAPSLETLWVGPYLNRKSPLELLSRALTVKAMEAPLAFQRLTSLGYDHYVQDPDEKHFPSSLSSILQLPFLRTLELRNCIEIGGLDTWSCPNGSSPVTNIKLTDCLLTNEALEKFIKSFGGVESFSCVRSAEPDIRKPMPSDAAPGFSVYNSALTPHKDTLEDLEIVLDDEECGWAWSYKGIGSLKHFSSLKRIQAAGAALLHWKDEDEPGHGPLEPIELIDILPTSLHTLSLTSWSPNTTEKLMSFGNSLRSLKAEQLPNLRHILDISGSLDHEDDVDYGIHVNWEEMLEALNVSFEKDNVVQVGHRAPDPYVSFRDCMGDPCEGKMVYPI